MKKELFYIKRDYQGNVIIVSTDRGSRVITKAPTLKMAETLLRASNKDLDYSLKKHWTYWFSGRMNVVYATILFYVVGFVICSIFNSFGEDNLVMESFWFLLPKTWAFILIVIDSIWLEFRHDILRKYIDVLAEKINIRLTEEDKNN